VLRLRPPGISLHLRSPNGKRRVEPPRREGRGLPPLCDISELQPREFHQALLDPDSFEDLPGKWQAAILTAEGNRPTLRIVDSD
jgi:hypothetical protein